MRNGTVPKKLFKYLIYRPDFFDELLLRITPPHEFNDPFEGVLSKDTSLHLLENGPFRTEEKRKDAINKLGLGKGVKTNMGTMEKDNSEQLEQSKSSFIDFLPNSIKGC